MLNPAELLRNGNGADQLQDPKEKRLLLVAQKAGALEAKAMSEGNRDRAYHFMRRMYRLLQVVASMRNEKEAANG